MNNTKLNVYKKVLPEVYNKFNDAKEFIKNQIEEISNEKLSMEEVTYLFINDYHNFY